MMLPPDFTDATKRFVRSVQQFSQAMERLSRLIERSKLPPPPQGRHLVQAALKQGRVHRAKQEKRKALAGIRVMVKAVKQGGIAIQRFAAALSTLPRFGARPDDIGLCLIATEEQ